MWRSRNCSNSDNCSVVAKTLFAYSGGFDDILEVYCEKVQLVISGQALLKGFNCISCQQTRLDVNYRCNSVLLRASLEWSCTPDKSDPFKKFVNSWAFWPILGGWRFILIQFYQTEVVSAVSAQANFLINYFPIAQSVLLYLVYVLIEYFLLIR